MNALGNRLQELRMNFNKDFIQWADAVLGATSLAMIRQRIRKTGGAPDGGKYKPYSSNNLVLRNGMFVNNSQKDKAYKEAQWFTLRGGESMAYLPGGYKRLRNIAGLQTNHKDFLYTGEMWMSVHVMGTKQVSKGFVTTVGTENEDSIMKLEQNEKREGKEILMITKQEEEKLTEILDKWLTNRINKAMNG